jgi:GntR family transcriptional regulator
MILTVDPASGLPLYLQIVQQVRWRAATGALQPGERLPSVRELATQLRINPNTVAKAITELEREGVVETRRGSGTFLAEAATRLTKTERRRLVAESCDRAVTDAFHLQWKPEELRALFGERVETIYGNQEESA